MSDQIGGAAALPEQQDFELQQLHQGAAQQQDAADAIAAAQGGEETEDEQDAESEEQDIFEQLMHDAMDEDFEVDEVDEVDAEDMWHMEEADMQVLIYTGSQQHISCWLQAAHPVVADTLLLRNACAVIDLA